MASVPSPSDERSETQSSATRESESVSNIDKSNQSDQVSPITNSQQSVLATEISSSKSAKQISEDFYKTIVFMFASILACTIGIIFSNYQSESKIEEKEKIVPIDRLATIHVLKEVTTQDGKKVNAYVEESVNLKSHEMVKEKITHEPTPEQKMRLTMISAFFIILLILIICLGILYFLRHFQSQAPPEDATNWLKQLVGVLIGAVIGFLGAPSGDSQVKTLQPPPVNVSPANR